MTEKHNRSPENQSGTDFRTPKRHKSVTHGLYQERDGTVVICINAAFINNNKTSLYSSRCR